MSATHHINVEGMTCTNCASSVERFLRRRGLEDVTVDFASGEVRFHSKGAIDLDEVRAGITKLGFRVIEAGIPEPWWSIEKKLTVSAVFTLPLLVQHIFMVAQVPYPAFLEDPLTQLALSMLPVAIGFHHFGGSAFRSLRGGVANMDVLIFLGSFAAFGYSIAGLVLGNPDMIFFETAATIITLVLLGNWLEHRSVRQTTGAIEELTRLQAGKARRLMPSGSVVELDLSEIAPGDVLLVNEGDRIPADGRISSGEALVDESHVTGESIPVTREAGEEVIGGSMLVRGSIRVEVTAVGEQALLGRMIELVKAARQDKPRLQRLADSISSIFVPLVVGISVLTFSLSVLVFALPFAEALMNSIAVLVISCPCALGLATPTAVTVGVGKLARQGILVKGASTLETLARIRRFVFDKTGTLTSGDFRILGIETYGENPAHIKSLIRELEQHSSHPIARSIVSALPADSAPSETDQAEPFFMSIEETKGMGVSGTDSDGRVYVLGSWKSARHATSDDSHDVYLTCGNTLLATIDLEDDLREGARQAVSWLHSRGRETVVLSGDKESRVRQVAESLGISTWFAGQQPDEKLRQVARLSEDVPTAMVGDGINDSPALARATLGISLSTGSQAAIQSAQVVLLHGRLAQLPRAMKISDATLLTIRQNLFWAFAYNIVAIPIAAMGYLNPMWAALFMAFSDLIVVGNSLRLKWRRF
jgi:Cu+-exporting ATPase